MIDLAPIMAEHGIVPRGVVHVGAHEGEEFDEYIALGARTMLFIEANPQVYAGLADRFSETRNVGAVNCAIGDHDGVATLHVTSNTQSSSLLPLKLHSRIYPTIVETAQVQVQCRRLDTLISALRRDPHEFNIIHLDIQGAEMMALSGARRQMIFADVIRTEVNLAELYEGCPLLDQMDAFLGSCGYERVALATPWHPSWGDAVYVGKPAITCSTMNAYGRWANQLFRYMFLKVYARKHNLELQLGHWLGTAVFDHRDPPVSYSFPTIIDADGKRDPLLADPLAPDAPRLQRVDFAGFFQSHTARYAPYRDYIRELFRPVPPLAAASDAALAALRQRGKTVFAIHLRRGDYSNIPGHPWMYIPPNEWYVSWLRSAWAHAAEPVLYIASDDVDGVIGDFQYFNPMTARDLGIEIPQAPHFIDYQILRHADRVAISNSSFSFHACMLNDVAGAEFVRPSRKSQSLVRFDPWNDDPLWHLPNG